MHAHVAQRTLRTMHSKTLHTRHVTANCVDADIFQLQTGDWLVCATRASLMRNTSLLLTRTGWTYDRHSFSVSFSLTIRVSMLNALPVFRVYYLSCVVCATTIYLHGCAFVTMCCSTPHRIANCEKRQTGTINSMWLADIRMPSLRDRENRSHCRDEDMFYKIHNLMCVCPSFLIYTSFQTRMAAAGWWLDVLLPFEKWITIHKIISWRKRVRLLLQRNIT